MLLNHDEKDAFKGSNIEAALQSTRICRTIPSRDTDTDVGMEGTDGSMDGQVQPGSTSCARHLQQQTPFRDNAHHALSASM